MADPPDPAPFADAGSGRIVAVYRWTVHAGHEERFRAAWRRGTRHITRLYGSCGSRLHRDEQGRFVAIAEWPDRESWQRARDAHMAYDDPPTRAAFLEALEGEPGDPLMVLSITDDLLLRPGRSGL